MSSRTIAGSPPRRLTVDAGRPLALRTIAAAVPVAYFVLYFAVVDVRYGLGWTFTFIAGSVILCGVVGLLLSFVALPPAIETDLARDQLREDA